MQVKFWSFAKKRNSTKKPETEGDSISFLYKDTTDLHNPSITISQWNDSWNYAQIGNIYFFIENCEVVTFNTFTVHLRIDVLATYKSEILNTNAFVARAANSYNNFLVDDFNTACAKINRTVIQADGAQSFYDTGEGCYILEVINALSSSVNAGFNAAYILTAEQMREISEELMTDSGMWEELIEIFKAPIDSIVSCRWLPINYNTACQQTGGDDTSVYLGAYDTGIDGYLVNMNFMEFHDDFDLTPYIPNNYLRNPKYLDIQMCLPYVGTVSIDVRQMVESAKDNMKLRVRVCLDVRSGKQLVMIVPQEYPNAPINTFETVIAEERPIASSAPNVAPVLYTAAAAVPMVSMGGGWLAGSLASLNTSMVESFRTNYTSIGTSGGSAFEGFGVANRCIILQRDKAFEPDDEYVRKTIGFPVNRALKLSSLGNGFVQTINASVELSGYSAEITSINDMLNGGIYIE